MPPSVRRAIRGVLTDIDDTLTTKGVLPTVAEAALARLAAANMPAVAITGRPVGLCDDLLARWPLAAIVGENGGVYLCRDGDGRIVEHYEQPADERARQRERLHAIAAWIVREVPGAALAVDRFRRETDVAIDWAENVNPLPQTAVERIVAMLKAEGLSTAVSSIHVHGWYGKHDKLSATRALYQVRFGIDLAREREHYIYVGDAPNDAPMFAFFPNSVGVANIARFLDRIDTPPAYITQRLAGEGFAELVELLLPT
jgi:HAD superfamily hydrolase (TIGR01484 family)